MRPSFKSTPFRKAANATLSALGFIAAYMLTTAFSIPVGIVLTVVGGFLFGAILGTLYAVIGATIGATAPSAPTIGAIGAIGASQPDRRQASFLR